LPIKHPNLEPLRSKSCMGLVSTTLWDKGLWILHS